MNIGDLCSVMPELVRDCIDDLIDTLVNAVVILPKHMDPGFFCLTVCKNVHL